MRTGLCICQVFFVLEQSTKQFFRGFCTIPGRPSISAIADVYDAISSDRTYHKSLPPAAAIRKIHEWSKFHFDPEVAANFIRAVGIYPVGSLVRLSNKRLAVVIEHQPRTPLYPKVRQVFDLHLNQPIQKSMALDLNERKHIKIETHENHEIWGIDPGEYL